MKRFFILLLGFTILSFGLSMMVKVQHVGLEPWVSVNVGLSNWKFTYGFWNAAVQSTFIILTWIIEKRPPRWGTFFNMFYISIASDFFIHLNFIPDIPKGIYSYLFYILSIFVTSVGLSLAIVTDLGSGARTQFYVTLHKITNMKLSNAKLILELTGLTVALIIGGPIFIGTIIFIFVSSFFIDRLVTVFKKIV